MFLKIAKYCKIIWISSFSKHKVRGFYNPGPALLDKRHGPETGRCCPLQVGQAFVDLSTSDASLMRFACMSPEGLPPLSTFFL